MKTAILKWNYRVQQFCRDSMDRFRYRRKLVLIIYLAMVLK
jgi:hypothetical protein